MLFYPIATVAVVMLGQSPASAASKKHPKIQKNDFMRAMDGRMHKREKKRRRLSVKDFQAELHGDSEKSKALRKKVIDKSTFVKPGDRKLQNYNNNNYNNYQNGNNNANYNANDDANYWQQDAQANYEYQVNNNNNNNNGETNYKYDANNDGSDDYFAAYGEWENSFGFDPTQYSLSYHRCAAVKQYDDEIAAQEDTTSVFATKRFAIFRFCPAQTCMGWQEEDDEIYCDEDYYGEDYCEYMEEYASYMKDYDETYENNGYSYNAQGNQQNQNGGEGDEGEGEGEDGEGDGEGEAEEGQYYGYQQEEEEDQYGARGEGCENNYGEYMMEMEEYLELMLEWQEERFETYCMYCEECMYNVYEQWLKNGGGRKLTYEEFKDSKEHRQLRQLSDEHRELGGYYGVCPEYDTCAEYQNMCGNGVDETYVEYFECEEVEKANGQVAWIGPHCAEDGFTITLGIYGDEYCNEYIGQGVSIASFIGEEMDIEEDALKSLYNSAHGTLDQLKYINEDNVCIPCRKGGLMWEEPGSGGDDDDGANYDDSEVNELCGSLYEVSARCDKHYRSYSNKSKQAKYAEAVAQEDLTCDFIDSIVMGNYNEEGNIDMWPSVDQEGQEQPGWMGNSIYAQTAGAYASQVTPLQIFGLLLSILAVGILAVWSMTLHKSLSKTGPWKPRRGFRAATPSQADISRQNSGIVMGRSQSNASYYMT